MDRQEWLEAFSEMSAADRMAIRARVIGDMGFEDAPGAGSVMAACIAIMEEAKAGRDPVKFCQGMLDEMAAMCTD
jgi:TctA family transporter